VRACYEAKSIYKDKRISKEMALAREQAIGLTGGVAGAIGGALVGIGLVGGAEKISKMDDWQKALVIVGVASATGMVTALLSYLAFSKITA